MSDDDKRRHSYLRVEEGVTRVSGELDLANADTLEQVLLNCDDPLLLDLSDVTFIDSFALRALIRTKRGRPEMRIVKTSDAVQRLIEITGLAEFFDE